jgi:hypothetical protein
MYASIPVKLATNPCTSHRGSAMKLLWSYTLLLVLVAAWLAPVQAGGHHASCESCAQPCEEKPTTQIITLYEVKQQKSVITVVDEKVVPIETVCQEKVCEMVPTWTEVKRTVSCCRKVPRLVEKEQVCCRLVPECVTDPCTGCTKTCYKPCTVVKKVQCTVWDYVTEQREVTEKVCKMVATEKIIEKRVCCGLQCVDVKRKELVTVISLVPIRVEVPIPPPAPKPCCDRPCCK